MNDMQMQAVCQTEGPVLILAGAGSGKTRVLTHRAAYLIEEKGINPYHIMAITFTNKAAGEMRDRIDNIVGFGSESIWVTTFHATCVRILRRYADRIGFGTNFTIYDTDDQKQLMKDICKRLQVDTKNFNERFFLNAISHAKDELIDAASYQRKAQGDYQKQRIAQIYTEYQQMLHKNNALDFDDLIMKTVELFRTDGEVLNSYQKRFRYIMVDEYQDTNTAQFTLIQLLASKYENLCVVGDDDQSIYKFRGANIRNILNFEHYFPNAVVIKLEQNYRSTQNILDAANAVIANNIGRKQKALWTENRAGAPVAFRQFYTSFDEAEYIIEDIQEKVKSGVSCYRDCAILYRTNAQSRLFEERCIVSNIPYKIVGGVNFYARKEIKDLLAYLKTIDNAQDDLAVRRILNVPKRGIGATTMQKVQEYADAHEISFYHALRGASEIPTLGRAAAKIKPFVTFIQAMRSKAGIVPLSDLLQELIDTTGYIAELEKEGTPEAQSRIENIEELQGKLRTYEQNEETPTLSGFLEEVALVADIDRLEDDSDYIVLMTLHSAKGLEFPNVYLAGMEDGLFPSYMSITSDQAQEEIEEERRLAYVGITRAKESLTLTCARQRMLRGQTQYNRVSRFVEEIPARLLQSEAVQMQHQMHPQMKPQKQKARETLRAKPMALQLGGYSDTMFDMAHGTQASMEGLGINLTGNHTSDKTTVDFDTEKNSLHTMVGKAVMYASEDTLPDRQLESTASYVTENTIPDRQFEGTASYGSGNTKIKMQPNGSRVDEKDLSAHTEAKANPNEPFQDSSQGNFEAYSQNAANEQFRKQLGYGVGDLVQHRKFGEGLVVKIVSGGRDFEVTVQFHQAGTKKMFAGFAKLKRLQ